MQVKVSYQRSRQPAPYESAVPAVEFTVSVDDGADPIAEAERLMAEAVRIVHSRIGLPVPAVALTPAHVTAPLVYADGASAMDVPAEDAPTGAPTPNVTDPAPRPRGRPRKNPVHDAPPPRETMDALAENAHGLAHQPEDMVTQLQPAAAPVEAAEPDTVPEIDVSDARLIEALRGYAGRHGGPKLRSVVESFGVMQASMLKGADRIALMKALAQ